MPEKMVPSICCYKSGGKDGKFSFLTYCLWNIHVEIASYIYWPFEGVQERTLVGDKGSELTQRWKVEAMGIDEAV
jgi:hypothetical protein